MKSHVHDPLLLELTAFAQDAAAIEGTWPLTDLPRLLADWPADAPAPMGVVEWQARGEARRSSGSEAEVWLHLNASTRVWRECQRCLGAVEVPLRVERSLRFVVGAAAAATLDADSEDDVLELLRSHDLRDMIEEELLLATLHVIRHSHCDMPMPSAVADEVSVERENPFAALAGLRNGKPPKPH